MINGNLDQFLDTGWFSGAELFYNGFIYWCEASYNEASRMHTFIVDRWRAENEGNKYYHSIPDTNGNLS